MPRITIARGDSHIICIPYLDSTGAALNLTGATVFFTANADNTPADDTQAVISKTVTSFLAPVAVTVNGVTYTAGQNTATLGIAWISLTNADTQSIAPGTYYYDAQVKDSLGNVTTSKVDSFVVTGDITRRIT